MAKHGPLKKPTMASLPVLLFMADHPELLLVGCTLMNSHGMYFAYHNGKRYRDRNSERGYVWQDEGKSKPEWYNNDVAPDLPKSLATHRWLQSGWMDTFIRGPSKNDDKDNPDNNWAWYDRPYQMMDDGRAMAEKWRAAYEEHAAKKVQERKAVERYIVISNSGRWAFNDKRKYAALCRVVSETPKRIYVERVFTQDEKNAGRFVSDYMPSIQGGKREYVERDVVTADGVTIDEYRAMRKVETANISWIKDLKEQEKAELDVIRDRYDLRREQNEAMFQDELRDAIEKVKK